MKTESGLGASGIPHVGSMGDAARAYGVKLALEQIGHRAEYIAFSDDLDGLRKVPAGLPDWLSKYLGFPVTSIPDPFQCHPSYGEHMTWLLRDAMDKCGIEYAHYSAAEAYKKGLFREQIRRILLRAEQVGQIIKEEVGQEKYTEVLPYFAICEKCGRIYTTKATKFLAREDRVVYECSGETEIKGHRLEGCGHQGEADIGTDQGKLTWKGDFAARWDALKINFEAYGKEIADSVRVNDRICHEVLGYPPPYHVRYELFLDKGGRRISKSVGNVFTPQTWLRYASPQSLLLLMFKRIAGTRTLSVDDVPFYMTELDWLEDVYFGAKIIEDRKELAKLRGLYEYSWLLKTPSQPRVHVPYNLLVYLAKVAPKGSEMKYLEEKLREYGFLKDTISRDLLERFGYARNWAEDFPEIRETLTELSEADRAAIKDLASIVRSESDEKVLQNAIFSVAKRHSIRPEDFFKTLYIILLGSPRGPRLGPYIKAMGNENVAQALERALRTPPEKPT